MACEAFLGRVRADVADLRARIEAGQVELQRSRHDHPAGWERASVAERALRPDPVRPVAPFAPGTPAGAPTITPAPVTTAGPLTPVPPSEAPAPTEAPSPTEPAPTEAPAASEDAPAIVATGDIRTVHVYDSLTAGNPKTRSDKKITRRIEKWRRRGYELSALSDNRGGASGILRATLTFTRVPGARPAPA